MRAFATAILCAAAILAASGSGWCLSFYWGSHPDKERLVLRFEASQPSRYELTRTGRRELTLLLPRKTVQAEPWPEPEAINGTEILSGVEPKQDRVLILTKTASFGFVHFVLEEESKLVVDVFADAMGASWNEADKQDGQARADEASPQGNGTQPKDKAKAAAKQAPKQGPQDEPEQPQPASKEKAEPKPSAHKEAANREQPTEPSNERSRADEPQASIRRTIESKAPPQAGSRAKAEPASSKDRVRKPASSRNAPALKGPYIRRRISNNPPPQGENDAVVIQEISTSPPPQLKKGRNETQPGKTDVSLQQGNGSTEPKARKVRSRQEGEGNQTSRAAGGGNASQAVPSPSLVSQGNGTGLAKVLAQNATRKVSYEQVIREAKGAMNSGKYAKAAEMFDALAADRHLPQKFLEEVLYQRADALFQKHRTSLKNGYLQVVSALEEAINYDPSSRRVPQALMRLFLVNLKVGNTPEARGYFNLLRDEYPGNQNIPSAHTYWGNYYLKRDDYRQAAKHYRTVVEDFPTSAPVAQAAIGLVRSLKEMELYREAWEVVQYINKRWPKRYLKSPEILRLSGYIGLKRGALDLAKSFYWRYYNVAPNVQNEDLLLARFGDVYLRMGEKDAARKMYSKAANRFPDQEGGLIAKMRLAEEGIHDKPGLQDMFSVFDQPYTLKPRQVYQEILQEHGDTRLAPLAQLKLAMWRLWKNQPLKALSNISRFHKRFSESDLSPRAKEVGRKALVRALNQAVERGGYARAVQLWREHAFLRRPQKELQAEPVLAAALSFWKTGEPEKALQLAKPYLQAKGPGETSENALKLMLNVYLSNQSWSDILEVTEEVPYAKLESKLQDQVRYARALALEHQGQTEKSEPLWLDVADSEHISREQEGHVFYFLGQHRMEDKEWEEVYTCAQEALSALMRTDDNQEKVLDCLDMLVEITRRSGRTLEALEWARRYGDHISKGSEHWPAYRYKLAEVYKQAGYLSKWKSTLKGLRKNHPQSYFGQMASSDLEEHALNQQASNFLQ